MNANQIREPRREDAGASLVMALAVMLAIGGILGGLVYFVQTSTRVSLSMQSSRNRQYAADGAVEQAIRMVQTDTTNKALLGAYCTSPSQVPFMPTPTTINGYNVRVECRGAPTPVLTTDNRIVIERNVLFLACVALAPATPDACTDTTAIVKAKVNFPTNAAGTVTGAFVQSWSVT